MLVDTKAPLVARKETVIDAPIERVWGVQTAIDDWATWQKDVTYAHLEGTLSKGTTFTWKAMGMKITSILGEVSKPTRIGWTGKSIGMRAIHIWDFESLGKRTKVITQESLSGWFPKIIALFQPDFLERSLVKALQTFKKQAEKEATW